MSDPSQFDYQLTRRYIRLLFGEEAGWQNDYGRHPVLAAATYARYESYIERVRAFCERKAKEETHLDSQKWLENQR